MKTFKATFRPERRKDSDGNLITSNVPLMLDLNCNGKRVWYNTGIRLIDINDFLNDSLIKEESGKGYKYAMFGGGKLSKTNFEIKLSAIRTNLNVAFDNLRLKKMADSSFNFFSKELLDEMRRISGDFHITTIKSSFITDFQNKVNDWYEAKAIGEGRKKHYDVLIRCIKRFLTINKMEGIESKNITAEVIKELYSFMQHEHEYVFEYPGIYSSMNTKELPVKERSENTLAGKLKMIKSFFRELEESPESNINISPVRMIPKKERESLLKESFDEPTTLTLKELQTIINKDVPENLQRVKDVFVFHCATGLRVSDFEAIRTDNILLSDEGFQYIKRTQLKTSKGHDLKGVEIPLMDFSINIINKYKDKLPEGWIVPCFFGNTYGKDGYNSQIKKLLEYVGIKRSVEVREDGMIKTIPLFRIASSKTARKCHVDIISKVEINLYGSGLHKTGSEAAKRYSSLSIEDKYKMYKIAFGEL